MREYPNWREEARKVISKVCCDGEYVDEAIEFIQNLLSKQKEALLTKLEGEVEKKERHLVSEPADYKRSDANVWREGFNEAIDQVKATINQLRAKTK